MVRDQLPAPQGENIRRRFEDRAPSDSEFDKMI